jgi:hypothetical protein
MEIQASVSSGLGDAKIMFNYTTPSTVEEAVRILAEAPFGRQQSEADRHPSAGRSAR